MLFDLMLDQKTRVRPRSPLNTYVQHGVNVRCDGVNGVELFARGVCAVAESHRG